MKILVLNCGSSSIKFQLFDAENNGDVIAKGIVERIGLDEAEITYSPNNGSKIKEIRSIPNHEVGIKMILEELVHENHGVIKSVSEITAAGHRVAHGGEKFKQSAIINEEVKKGIADCIELAPLHNPANLKGILSVENILPGITQVAVFDTSFHQTMPEHSYLYAVPYKFYEQYKLRRYGFHGTSHKYVAEKAANILGKNWQDLNIITCHLGNGSSVAAIQKGLSIDTSMGFTPVEGLMMGTRTGDLDLGALLFLMEKEDLTVQEANNLINKKSGLIGISGLSFDMRDLEKAAENGNHRAAVARDMFTYRVKKYVGAYMAALGSVDLIIFTGGIGENDGLVREKVCENMEFYGIDIDKELNKPIRGKDVILSKPNSKVTVMTVTTNEEFVIANETRRLT